MSLDTPPAGQCQLQFQIDRSASADHARFLPIAGRLNRLSIDDQTPTPRSANDAAAAKIDGESNLAAVRDHRDSLAAARPVQRGNRILGQRASIVSERSGPCSSHGTPNEA